MGLKIVITFLILIFLFVIILIRRRKSQEKDFNEKEILEEDPFGEGSD